eukprot:COSAG01_NODE_1907_length_8929_cov_130.365798_5_plen_55_part_00
MTMERHAVTFLCAHQLLSFSGLHFFALLKGILGDDRNFGEQIAVLYGSTLSIQS